MAEIHYAIIGSALSPTIYAVNMEVASDALNFHASIALAFGSHYFFKLIIQKILPFDYPHRELNKCVSRAALNNRELLT